MMVALVCIMGLKDQTLMTPSTSKLATLLPELSTLHTDRGTNQSYIFILCYLLDQINEMLDPAKGMAVWECNPPAVHDWGVMLAVLVLTELNEWLLHACADVSARLRLICGRICGITHHLCIGLWVRALSLSFHILRKYIHTHTQVLRRVLTHSWRTRSKYWIRSHVWGDRQAATKNY